jgi:hypothetical protein
MKTAAAFLGMWLGRVLINAQIAAPAFFSEIPPHHLDRHPSRLETFG